MSHTYQHGRKLVTWVHLSDWHQRGADFDRLVVRDALIRDLQQRESIDPRLARIDLTIFSGDAAFRGITQEFDAAREFFFSPVLQAVDLNPDRLLIVPGNHDLDRDIVEEMMPAKLQQPLSSAADVNNWLFSDVRRARAMEPLTAYSRFVEKFTGQTSSAFATKMALSIGAGTVHILGLNTAWMCGRKNRSGEYDDDRRLVIGEPQVHDALEWLAQGDIRIIVQHHPFEWLARFDRDLVESRIKAKADFILWGHEHSPKLEAGQGPNGGYITVPAGAAYDRRQTSDSRYTNSYNMVCLDLDTGEGTIYFRRWSETKTAWIADNDTADNGSYYFRLPERIVNGRKEATALRSKVEASNAGVIYRHLLLKSCDIIDLANLPGQDRLLVQRQLDLRRLFVPLHLSVESMTNDDATLQEIEEGRLRRRNSAIDYGEDDRVKVGELLHKNKRVVILGVPGGGKTTLARWIATCYLLRLGEDPDLAAVPEINTLPNQHWLPILIRCRDLDRDGSTDTLDTMLEQTLRKAEIDPNIISSVQEYIRGEIAADRAILIVDGLDEISESARRIQLCQQLERISDAHPELRIIATSRIVGYRHMGRRLGRNFVHTTICDLEPNEKFEFARRWCELTIPVRQAEAAELLISDLKSNDRVQRLTGNPMLLTTMALVKRSIGKLPHRRAELYIEAVKALLNWRNDRGELLEAEEALPQLNYIAYHMHDKGIQSIDRRDLIDTIHAMRKDYPNIHYAFTHTPEQFIDLLESRTGILLQSGFIRRNGDDEPIYEFRHLTFQEFLTAQALIKRVHPRYTQGSSLASRISVLVEREIGVSLYDGEDADGWQEVFRLCLTLCDASDVDLVLEAILHSNTGSSAARSVLAGYCLADEPNASDRAVESVLDAIINGFNYSQDEDEDEDEDEDSNTLSETFPPDLNTSLLNSRWRNKWIDCLFEKIDNVSGRFKVEIGSKLEDAIDIATEPSLEICSQLANDIRSGARDAVFASLYVMNLAFQKTLSDDIIINSGIVGALLHAVEQGGDRVIIHIWPLCWLAQNYDVPIDPRIIADFLKKADAGEAFFACWLLTYRPSPSAIPELSKLAIQPRSRAARQARRGLLRLKTPPVQQFLKELLAHDDPAIRIDMFSILVVEELGLRYEPWTRHESKLDPLYLSLERVKKIELTGGTEIGKILVAVGTVAKRLGLTIN